MKFVQSPYWQSRQSKKIDGVVIHTMVGGYEGTIKYFQNNDRQVSAHYCVSLDGDITQMVKEEQGANHAGITSNPKTKVYKGYNPNWNTVGIECADDRNPAGADRSRQTPAVAKLVRDICLRHNIPIDRDHICGHRDLYDKKTCPGNLDVDEIIKLAKNGIITPEVITESTVIPQIVNGQGRPMEVQAIRSTLLAKDERILQLTREKDGQDVTIGLLNEEIKKLKNTPSVTPEIIEVPAEIPTQKVPGWLMLLIRLFSRQSK